MSSEPFILRDQDRALEWVNLFSKSCGTETEFAAAVLSSLCGFGSWEVMMFAIESMPPSPFDESIPPEHANERRRRYLLIMTHEYGIKPIVALAVTDYLSPSTGKNLQNFNAAELIEEFDSEDDLDNEDFLVELFGCALSEEAIEIVMPLAGELNESWIEVFDFLGWETEFLPDGYDVAGSPSFMLEDPVGESPGFPVYLTHALPPPSFNRQISESPTIRMHQCLCLGDFISDWSGLDCPGFLLLSAYPQTTRHNGKSYCYIGQMYVEAHGQWIDLLLNSSCTDVWTLLELNSKVQDGFKGASKLSERTDLFGKRVALLLSGFQREFEDAADWSILTMKTTDGWSVVKGVSNDHYDPEDLEPYTLSPLLNF